MQRSKSKNSFRSLIFSLFFFSFFFFFFFRLSVRLLLLVDLLSDPSVCRMGTSPDLLFGKSFEGEEDSSADTSAVEEVI
jgi:hypothetical protein